MDDKFQVIWDAIAEQNARRPNPVISGWAAECFESSKLRHTTMVEVAIPMTEGILPPIRRHQDFSSSF